jgi:hypothetical protein
VEVVGPEIEVKDNVGSLGLDSTVETTSESVEITDVVEFDSYVPDDTNPIVFEITEVSRIGLVTVSINQPLKVDPDALIVTYDQRSDELIMNFNWTLAGDLDWKRNNQNITEFFVQCDFEKPLSVSVGNIVDKVIIYVPVR